LPDRDRSPGRAAELETRKRGRRNRRRARPNDSHSRQVRRRRGARLYHRTRSEKADSPRGSCREEKNITTLKAADGDTNLPPESCDSIFMRLVYHHLTKPADVDASLFRSLKPGGLLAVIDEEPRPGSPRVEGVPENRSGHGVPRKILI